MADEKFSNFLTEIIDADLAEGKVKEIHTRFPPERCLSRQAGIVRYCLIKLSLRSHHYKQLAVGSPFAKLNYPCGKFH